MKKGMAFSWLLVGVVLALGIEALIVVSGVIPMKASSDVGFLDRVGNTMWERSVDARAPSENNPLEGQTAAIEEGFAHFKSMCVHCHGAPGVSHAEWVSGMQPMPPELGASEVQKRSDGELFYIIQNGVRMTGMPPFGGNHGEEEIWKLVAFVRELPSLSEERRQELKDAIESRTQGHHGEEQKSAEHGTKEAAEHGGAEHAEHGGDR